MHRSDFCMVSAFRDWIMFRSVVLLRALLLLISCGMVLAFLARAFGLFKVFPYPFFGPPSLVNAIGGFLFGIGMVLAGGCVVGILYKLGAGSRVAGIGLLGLLVGSGLYAEIHPWWVQLAKKTSFSAGSVTLPQLLGWADWVVILPLVLLAGWFSREGLRKGEWRQRSPVDGYLQPWLAALVLAGIGLVSALVIGMPMGVTTSYAKVAAWFERLVWPQHVASLEFFNLPPHSFHIPLGEVQLAGSPGPAFDGIAAVQYPLIIGIVLGSALSAGLLREWRLKGKLPLRQAVFAGCGGVLMGLASRMTPGCNVWHLWGGVPILALQSLLFVVGLLPGTWVGCRLLEKLVFSRARGINQPHLEGLKP